MPSQQVVADVEWQANQLTSAIRHHDVAFSQVIAEFGQRRHEDQVEEQLSPACSTMIFFGQVLPICVARFGRTLRSKQSASPFSRIGGSHSPNRLVDARKEAA